MHADKLTADGDRRLVRHGHLPEREILSGFAKAAADEANCRKLRITGPKLAGRDALTKGGYGIVTALLPCGPTGGSVAKGMSPAKMRAASTSTDDNRDPAATIGFSNSAT